MYSCQIGTKGMSINDALDVQNAAFMIPRAMTTIVQEGIEPLLIGEKLLQKIQYKPGMTTVFQASARVCRWRSRRRHRAAAGHHQHRRLGLAILPDHKPLARTRGTQGRCFADDGCVNAGIADDGLLGGARW